jgi:AraC-like DNA-binding protein
MKTVLMNTTSRADEPRNEVEARLQAAVAFMAREFRRNPRLAEIARVAHFSEYHFHRLFRRRFGKTPKRVLVERQIEEAKRLMLAGQRPADAAGRAGFAHQSHLTSRFKAMTGVTPKQWLLANRKRGGTDGSGGTVSKK